MISTEGTECRQISGFPLNLQPLLHRKRGLITT